MLINFQKYDKNISLEHHKKLLFELLKIRLTEEATAVHHEEQLMKCPIHYSIGQEAIAVGVNANLNQDDWIFGTHRYHSHYLAKGGDLKKMIAEFYGKDTGCNRGIGGSMHLADFDAGVMGGSAIVGANTPIAAGAAMGFMMQNQKRVAVAFFGDGSIQEGTFAETLNWASLKKLPVIFVCENNFYAVQTHTHTTNVNPNIYKYATNYLMPGILVDGNNILEIYKQSQKAINRARQGLGPTLIEARTYRWVEHCGPFEDCEFGWRTKKELKEWQKKCPVKNYEKYLLSQKIIVKSEIKKIKDRLKKEINEAFDFAKKSPLPTLTKNDLLKLVY
ncbi:thiamine pyrophosphate-dependent dehydrogenase E1 component subunit alpha [Patescibacteria group bacterium]|nr:thiamine pyrophosphate-dependent dehydrogenase E1 component subunit alpha [Patescibacteria group bacterium]MBU4511782.1 thiamine pyrophosphate-dependent dehydrogenase E1 component subunit alpha [Patescibacteria group bacterium]MCG2693240.1 thiamine pyrophosphate-dependent dehydrogenase E1 component subunit alpha [Candidatus Parcubacteria bacterium]